MTLKTFNVNDVLNAADVNEYLVAGKTQFVTKPSNTNRASTTTPTIDPDLLLQVDANKTYEVEVYLQLISVAAAGFKWRFNAPAGAVLYGNWTNMVPIPGSGTGQMGLAYDPALNLFNATQNITTFDFGLVTFIRVSGILTTAGTASGFSLAWSQQTSNGTNTQLLAGSSMLIRRVS